MPARRFAFHLAHRRLADIECCLHMENHIVDMAFRQLVIPHPAGVAGLSDERLWDVRTESNLKTRHVPKYRLVASSVSADVAILQAWK
jgi:hypothetical protein